MIQLLRPSPHHTGIIYSQSHHNSPKYKKKWHERSSHPPHTQMNNGNWFSWTLCAADNAENIVFALNGAATKNFWWFQRVLFVLGKSYARAINQMSIFVSNELCLYVRTYVCIYELSAYLSCRAYMQIKYFHSGIC